jgi:hypothetical protein
VERLIDALKLVRRPCLSSTSSLKRIDPASRPVVLTRQSRDFASGAMPALNPRRCRQPWCRQPPRIAVNRQRLTDAHKPRASPEPDRAACGLGDQASGIRAAKSSPSHYNMWR